MNRMPARRRASRLVCAALASLGISHVAHAAPLNPMVVTATVLSKSSCKFTSSALTLDFGTIDPASSSDATVSATATIRCGGAAPVATFDISAGNGLYSTGPGARRMRNLLFPTEFMAYSLTLTPSTATIPKNAFQDIQIVGTIRPFEFANARVGKYQDTVVLTLVP